MGPDHVPQHGPQPCPPTWAPNTSHNMGPEHIPHHGPRTRPTTWAHRYPNPQLPHSTGTQTHSYPTRQLPHSLGPRAFSIHQVHRPYYFTRSAGFINPHGPQAFSIDQTRRHRFTRSTRLNNSPGPRALSTHRDRRSCEFGRSAGLINAPVRGLQTSIWAGGTRGVARRILEDSGLKLPTHR